MRGARDGPQFWQQQTWDQNGIVRQYMKWDHRLEYQDNPGLVVSRALQVALSEPQGPRLPEPAARDRDAADRRRALPDGDAAWASTRRIGPDPDAIREAADVLVQGQQSGGRGVALGPQSGDGARAGAAVRAAGDGAWSRHLADVPELPLRSPAVPEPEQPGRRRRGAGAGSRRAVDARRSARRSPKPTSSRSMSTRPSAASRCSSLTADLRLPSDSLLAHLRRCRRRSRDCCRRPTASAPPIAPRAGPTRRARGARRRSGRRRPSRPARRSTRTGCRTRSARWWTTTAWS